MKRISVTERELREYIEAAEEVAENARHAWAPPSESMPEFTFNALEESTERRYSLALDALKFDMAKEAPVAATHE